MRFWIVCASLMACGKYALAWHVEIASAWQNHPGVTLFLTLISFIGVDLATQSVRKGFTMTFPATQQLQHSEKKPL
jgi:hypothetical protein